MVKFGPAETEMVDAAACCRRFTEADIPEIFAIALSRAGTEAPLRVEVAEESGAANEPAGGVRGDPGSPPARPLPATFRRFMLFLCDARLR
jgi:hypothetical protein